jgi:hypothetical protein
MEPPTPNPEPTPEPIPAATPPEPSADLEEARAQIATLTTERDAAVGAVTAAAALAAEQLTAAQQTALDAHRRAVLAENAGQVIQELVQGATPADIDASIESAKAAYTRVADAVKAAVVTAPPVPAGASPRSEPSAEDLSPLAKITNALSRNGR